MVTVVLFFLIGKSFSATTSRQSLTIVAGISTDESYTVISQMRLFKTLVPSLMRDTTDSCRRYDCWLIIGYSPGINRDKDIEVLEGKIQEVKDALSFFIPQYSIQMINLVDDNKGDYQHQAIARGWSTLVTRAFDNGADITCLARANAAINYKEWPILVGEILRKNEFLSNFGVVSIAAVSDRDSHIRSAPETVGGRSKQATVEVEAQGAARNRLTSSCVHKRFRSVFQIPALAPTQSTHGFSSFFDSISGSSSIIRTIQNNNIDDGDIEQSWLLDVYSIFNSSFVLLPSPVASALRRLENSSSSRNSNSNSNSNAPWPGEVDEPQQVALQVDRSGVLSSASSTNGTSTNIKHHYDLQNFVSFVGGLAPPEDMEAYLGSVHTKRRHVARWLAGSSLLPNYVWNPLSLAYGTEGLFHAYYCQHTPGFIC